VTANDPARSTHDAGGTRSLPSHGAGNEGLVRPAPAVERDSEDPPRAVDAAIVDCGLYEDGHRRPGRVPLDQAGDVARTTSGFVWIGLQQATAKDIVAVADKFGLPPLAVEDAVKAHQRPKLEVYDDVVVFAVLKPVRYVDHEEVVNVSEIALFLGASYVVTVRHGKSDVLRRVRSELDRNDSELLTHGPTGVLYRAADLVVDGYEEAITYINEDVDEIESQVFGSNGEDDHSERIYKLKREIAKFRRAVLPLATPLHRLANGSVPGVDKAVAPYFRDVHDHMLRAADAIEGHDRLLSDVLQADLSRVAARQAQVAVRQNEIAVKQNEDMRKISAWAAIALVPSAIAGIYGMNFHHMPELAWEYGYFLVIGVIVSVCLGLYRLFRRNGWL
jgi:magnesium transporter